MSPFSFFAFPNGIAGSTFYLHLKEFEFRFNYRNENLKGAEKWRNLKLSDLDGTICPKRT